MKLEYTGRHVDITPALKTHVENHFEKIKQIIDERSATKAHIIMDVEKSRHKAEIVLSWRDHTLTATETGKDMYLAFSKAIGKIEKQALKLKKKMIAKKQSREKIAFIAPEPDGEIAASPLPPRIINNSRYAVKPMTTDEAVLHLNQDNDQFIVFHNAETDRFSVLYRRKDGNFGLIQP
jgi:putative sigma-54 modulation protein